MDERKITTSDMDANVLAEYAYYVNQLKDKGVKFKAPHTSWIKPINISDDNPNKGYVLGIEKALLLPRPISYGPRYNTSSQLDVGTDTFKSIDWIDAMYPSNILEKLSSDETNWLLDNDWTTHAIYASNLFGIIPNHAPLHTFQKHLNNPLISNYLSMNKKERLNFIDHLSTHLHYARHLYGDYQSSLVSPSKPF